MSVLSNNIKYMRLMRGLSQKKFAEKLHKSANAVSNWEKGTTSPDVELIETICRVLEVTPNQIYGWDKCQELDDFMASQKEIINKMDDLTKQRQELDEQIKIYAQQIRFQKFRVSNDL